METILMVGVLAFFTIMFFYGYNKGVIIIVLSLAATILSIVLSMFLAEPFGNFIKSTGISDKVNKQMEEYVEKYIENEVDFADKAVQEKYINKLNLPKSIREKLLDNDIEKEMVSIGAESFSSYIAIKLTDILIQAMSVMILFLVIRIILKIVITLLNIISMLPVIKTVNKTFGGVAGLAEGLLIIWVVAIIVTAFGSTNFGSEVLEAINSNNFLSFIYNNNILFNLL